jgi:hypothetical protein
MATLGMQTMWALGEDRFFAYRALVSVGSVALASWAWRTRELVIAGVLSRLVCSLFAGASFWLAVLEALLRQGPVLARGLLWILAAAALHVTLFLFATHRRGEQSGGDRFVMPLSLSASAVALTLAVIESGFHAWMPANVYEVVPDDPRSPPCHTWNPRSGWRLEPGFRGRQMHPEFPGVRVDINALGFRDGLDETAPPWPGDVSILVLGDSLAFGTGVAAEETFHELLERNGRATITTLQFHVYGAGVPGMGQVDEWRRLAELAPMTRPDVVIVAMYEGNDLEDNLREAARLPQPAAAPPAPDPAVPLREAMLLRYLRGVRRLGFWLGSSSAFQYLLPTVERLRVRLGLDPLSVPSNSILDQSLRTGTPPLIEQALAATREAYRALALRCRELGADLIVLLIPAAIQAEPARFQDFLRLHDEASRGSYSRTELHRHLIDMLAGLGIRVVDPLPALTAEAEAGRPCYHREGHWNARGHALAADLLVPVLAEIVADRQGRNPPRS